MKKFFLSSFALMAMMVAAIGFVSCGSDDDGDNGNGGSEQAKKAEFSYCVILAKDMAKYINVEIEYLDNGQTKTEKITKEEWIKTINVSSLPAKFSYKINLSRNTVQIDPTANHILGLGVSKAYKVYDGSGKAYSQLDASYTKNFSSFQAGNLTEEKLVTYINKHNGVYEGSFELNTEGKLVDLK